MALPQKQDVYYGKFVEGLPSLVGMNVAITGTTSGTGYWAAVAVIRKNAETLFVLNRKSERSEAAVKKLLLEKENSGSQTEIMSIDCDLMSFDSVRKAAEELNQICEKKGGLNVLANNAGIMMFPDLRTVDGFDVQMQTNHLSSFLLTKLLLPSFQLALQMGKEVRICQHSAEARGFGHKLDAKYFKKSAENGLGGNGIYSSINRYHMTKLSNSVFAMKLHKELASHGFDASQIKSVAAEPGVSFGTNLLDNLFAAHKKTGSANKWSFRIFMAIFQFIQRHFIANQSSADSSMPLLQACFGPDVSSGDLFYPQKIRTGLPFKGISKADKVLKNIKHEKGTMDESNQNMLWKLSEEAIEEKFFP